MTTCPEGTSVFSLRHVLITSLSGWSRGDILDGRTLEKALEGIDCVVHLAARVTTPFADSDAHSFDQVNHWGTAQLAYAIEKSFSAGFESDLHEQYLHLW